MFKRKPQYMDQTKKVSQKTSLLLAYLPMRSAKIPVKDPPIIPPIQKTDTAQDQMSVTAGEDNASPVRL